MSQNDHNKLDKKACSQWIKEPNVNPISRQNIPGHGSTYSRLANACRSILGLGQIPGMIKQGNARSTIVNKTNVNKNIATCHIHKCDTFTLKSEVQRKSLSGPARAIVYDSVKHPTGAIDAARDYLCGHTRILSRVREFYKAWKMCEAPILLDLRAYSHDTWFIAFSHLTEYMYYLYGDVIIPGLMHLRLHDNTTLIIRDTWGAIDDKVRSVHPDNFEELVEFVRNSPHRHHVVWTSVPSINSNIGHAVVVVLSKPNIHDPRSKRQRDIVIEILDPNMISQKLLWWDFWEFTRTLEKYLRSQAKKLNYTVKGLVVHRELYGKLQGKDALMPKSYLDSGGYCGVWSIMMMEIIAKSSRDQNNHDSSVSQYLVDAFSFKNASPAIWRKLIIDYFFTRVLDAYAMASTLYYPTATEFFESNYIQKYVSTFDAQQALANIIAFIPWFESEVYDRLP